MTNVCAIFRAPSSVIGGSGTLKVTISLVIPMVPTGSAYVRVKSVSQDPPGAPRKYSNSNFPSPTYSILNASLGSSGG